MKKEVLGNISLYNCDCMEYMKTVPDKYFDLAIVDPPYGINAAKMQMASAPNRKGKGQYSGISTAVKLKGRLNTGSGKLKNRKLNTSLIDWDNETPSVEYFNELFRISKNQIIWGYNYFMLPPTRGIVCWDKKQPWENFSQFELAWTSFDVPAYMISYSNRGGANEEIKIHPTQKPEFIYKKLLEKFAKQGNKIFDSHGGSMTHARACHDLGFELTVCEINEMYYSDAKRELIKHQSQQSLFKPEEIYQASI